MNLLSHWDTRPWGHRRPGRSQAEVCTPFVDSVQLDLEWGLVLLHHVLEGDCGVFRVLPLRALPTHGGLAGLAVKVHHLRVTQEQFQVWCQWLSADHALGLHLHSLSEFSQPPQDVGSIISRFTGEKERQTFMFQVSNRGGSDSKAVAMATKPAFLGHSPKAEQYRPLVLKLFGLRTPFHSLYMIEDSECFVFIWVISIAIYYVKNGNWETFKILINLSKAKINVNINNIIYEKYILQNKKLCEENGIAFHICKSLQCLAS